MSLRSLREKTIPRLLYIGDVPIEASFHGSVLLYRLLQTYPPERLRIIEAGISESVPHRRLPNVIYERSPIRGRRWLHSRFHRWASAALSLDAASRIGIAQKAFREFRPEAVLTVAHDYSWITAAAFARRHNLPLHLIIHDDWPSMTRDIPPVDRWVRSQFCAVYRQAVSRLCVSPYMNAEYELRYGVTGSVLYPLRAPIKDLPMPLSKCISNRPELVFGFGGTINTGGHVKAILDLATALESSNGILNLYGPIARTDALKSGLGRKNIRLCGLVPAEDFVQKLQAEVDVLFAPMSFAPGDRGNMRLNFPSKLTEYTATGLPILIYGPDYSSGVRWAVDNPGVAEAAIDEFSLLDSIGRLANSNHRAVLAKTSMMIGQSMFGHEAVVRLFLSSLQSA